MNSVYYEIESIQLFDKFKRSPAQDLLYVNLLTTICREDNPPTELPRDAIRLQPTPQHGDAPGPRPLPLTLHQLAQTTLPLLHHGLPPAAPRLIVPPSWTRRPPCLSLASYTWTPRSSRQFHRVSSMKLSFRHYHILNFCEKKVFASGRCPCPVLIPTHPVSLPPMPIDYLIQHSHSKFRSPVVPSYPHHLPWPQSHR